MSFKFVHNNFNVRDLEKSLAFYKEALGLDVVREHHAEDGSFTLVYLGDSKTSHPPAGYRGRVSFKPDQTSEYGMFSLGMFPRAFIVRKINA